MYSSVVEHVRNKIISAKLETEPYTYLQVDDIWPEDFYREMIHKKIPSDCLFSLKEIGRVADKYSDGRLILKLFNKNTSILSENIRGFWESVARLLQDDIAPLILDKFGITEDPYIKEILYTRDGKDYWLGPHTDRADKILTALFYLPQTAEHPELGTAIFTPKVPGFQGKPGAHYKYEGFDTFKVVNYVPNKMFCFLKSGNSFHGVLPIDAQVDRDLLIFDMIKNIC